MEDEEHLTFQWDWDDFHVSGVKLSCFSGLLCCTKSVLMSYCQYGYWIHILFLGSGVAYSHREAKDEAGRRITEAGVGLRPQGGSVTGTHSSSCAIQSCHFTSGHHCRLKKRGGGGGGGGGGRRSWARTQNAGNEVKMNTEKSLYKFDHHMWLWQTGYSA